MLSNRAAIYIAALVALAGGLAPIVGDLDWTSTVGVLTAVATIGAVVVKWLDGWQAYEARADVDPLVLPDGESPSDIPPQAQ